MALCSLCFFFHVTDNFFSFLKNDVALKWPATSSLISTNTSNIGQKKKKKFKAASHISITKTQMLKRMQLFHFDPWDYKKRKKNQIDLRFGQGRQTFRQTKRKLCLPCTVQMYNLHVEKKDKKTNKPTTCVQKMANSFCSSRKVYNLQTKTSTKHFTDHSLVFRQAEKKTLLLTTYLKT